MDEPIRNIEYQFFFGANVERIHLSGGQISWLGENVGKMRSAFEIIERTFSETNDTEITNTRLEAFINLVCQTYVINVHPRIYFTETEIVRT